jgi:hypothetical protein
MWNWSTLIVASKPDFSPSVTFALRKLFIFTEIPDVLGSWATAPRLGLETAKNRLTCESSNSEATNIFLCYASQI